MEISQVQDIVRKALAAEITFPQIVQTLTAAGWESYHVDLIRHEYRYYRPDGQSHVVTADLPPSRAASAFSAKTVKASIQMSQSGQIQYKEFLRRMLDAGCVYYIVYLTGRQVAYFGRNGEMFTEHFPGTR